MRFSLEVNDAAALETNLNFSNNNCIYNLIWLLFPTVFKIVSARYAKKNGLICSNHKADFLIV